MLYYSDDWTKLYFGDAKAELLNLPDDSVDCVVTSPPYFGLRSYLPNGHADKENEIGTEKTPEQFVANLVEVFREVRRILKPDGRLWLNLGDSYANDGKWGGVTSGKHSLNLHGNTNIGRRKVSTALRPKNLIGIPWRVAFALQNDGWILRSDIIWHKANPLPEAVRDRPTREHEYLFLFAKSTRYYYNSEAIMEDCSVNTHARISQNVAAQVGSVRAGKKINHNMKAVVSQAGLHPKAIHDTFNSRQNSSFSNATVLKVEKRNKRTVWKITSKGYQGAHFSTFPAELIKPCILAGCPTGGVVLDPFTGSGTTLEVARRLGCRSIGIDLDAENFNLILKRVRQGQFAFVEEEKSL